MRYKTIMTTEDGATYTEEADKLATAEHFYDAYVENGLKSNKGFCVAILENNKEKISFNGWHTA